jgi:hypothetical protein
LIILYGFAAGTFSENVGRPCVQGFSSFTCINLIPSSLKVNRVILPLDNLYIFKFGMKETNKNMNRSRI